MEKTLKYVLGSTERGVKFLTLEEEATLEEHLLFHNQLYSSEDEYPLLDYFPSGLSGEAVLTGTYNDQGWGNQKGRVQIFHKNGVGDAIAETGFAPHSTAPFELKFSFPTGADSSEYGVYYYVGSGKYMNRITIIIVSTVEILAIYFMQIVWAHVLHTSSTVLHYNCTVAAFFKLVLAVPYSTLPQ